VKEIIVDLPEGDSRHHFTEEKVGGALDSDAQNGGETAALRIPFDAAIAE
jgi:hypothetical protein